MMSAVLFREITIHFYIPRLSNIITMAEAAFEKQIMNKLANVEKKVDYIMEYIEDTKLSEDDKKALEEALKEEREGKLLSKKQVFG